jgi:hypothetical protein
VDGPEGWPLYLDRYAALLKGTADMAPIVTSAEIGRPAAEVFACATGPARFSQWQQGVADGHLDGPAGGTPAAGAKCVTTRRIGGASRRPRPSWCLSTRPGPGACGAQTARSGRLSRSWSSPWPVPAPG